MDMTNPGSRVVAIILSNTDTDRETTVHVHLDVRCVRPFPVISDEQLSN